MGKCFGPLSCLNGPIKLIAYASSEEPAQTYSLVKAFATRKHKGGMKGEYQAKICYSYTMGCPPVRGDNPRALASGLSYIQVDKHGITSLYHLHQCRPCTSRDILC